MSPQLIVALVISIISFGGAWVIQDWRYDAKEKEHVEQKLAEVRFKSAEDIRRLEDALDAQAKAAERARRYRLDAAALRTSVNSLSSYTADTMRTARASQAACLDRVDTLGKLFDASTEAYADMAGTADRHASDIQTLRDSWPKSLNSKLE